VATIASAPRIYLDTSAYLCLLLSEKGHEAIARETTGAELVSSVLLVLETRRNLTRLAREGAISGENFQACLDRLERDVDEFALRDLTLDLCASTDMPVVSTPRSLDLVHLRTALWFHRERPLDRFLTQDQAQAAAAREIGLPGAT
jgi:hypothetical protein